MPKFFVKSNQIENNKITILGEDVNHIKNVLRLQIDDDINVCNLETGENYTCGITKLNIDNIECNIFNRLPSKAESNIHINIFQGLPKSDKMELIIQKCVELGANEITPVYMNRCVVKLDSKSEIKKIERWKKVSEVAAKQCGRDIVPHINEIINIKNVCNLICEYDIVLLAYENEEKNSLKNELLKFKCAKNRKLKVGIIIGPEGGLEQEEVELLKQKGAKVITLGKRILRTETAPIVITSIVMYELENLGGNI